MGFWCRRNEELRFCREKVFQVRAGGNGKERQGKAGWVEKGQTAASAALMQN
jgi:hypothetical protein